MQEFKFFQQKPLLVTEDGYQVFPYEPFVSVNIYKMKGVNRTIEPLTIVDRFPISKKLAEKFKQDDDLIYFKYRKNAENFVKVAKKYL